MPTSPSSSWVFMSRAVFFSGAFFLCALCLSADDPPAASPPLHEQIDKLMAASLGPRAEIADDATFIRRVTLDLIGRIPTHDEVTAFLGSEEPAKRAQLVDRLLASPEYADHMAIVFDVMLMERRGNKHVKADEFRAYLHDALTANRSYRDIVAEILAADGTDDHVRPASAFYLEREVEPHLLTRDVGRVFFGVDLQCAQCHDHPLIDDYHQADYYGLNAFFVRSSLFRPDNKKPALIGEAATGEADFKSVFTEREGRLAPRIPGGDEMVEVSLKPTDQYEVAPEKTVRGVPKFSRRDQLARMVLENASPQFNKNIVNRLWAHLLGRGLVHPVDLMHSDNPPTHPELLDRLASRFADSNYDVKAFLREVTLTKVYQRDFRLPSLDVEISEAGKQIEQAKAVADDAKATLSDAQKKLDAAITQVDDAIAKAKPFRDAETAANKAVAEAAKKRDDAQAKVTKTEGVLATQQKETELLNASAASTKTAVETLKDDKELAGALATIEKRVAAHAEGLKKTEATLQAERDALAAKVAALQAASAAADKAISERVAPEQLVRDTRSQMFAVRDVVQRLRLQTSLADKQVKYWESLLSFDTLNKEETRLVATIETGSRDLEQQRANVIKQTEAANSAEQIRNASQETLTAKQTAKDEAEKSFAAAQEVASSLKESIAKAESVQSKVDGDESLPQAIALLGESLKQAEGVVGTRDVVRMKAIEESNTAKAAFDKAVNDWKAATEAVAASQAMVAKTTGELAKSRTDLDSVRQQQATAADELIATFADRGYVRELTALSPEQLAQSLLVATGYLNRLKAAAEAQADKRLAKLEEDHKKAVEAATKESKPAPEKLKPPARETVIAEEFAKSLGGVYKRFADLYGAEAGQPQKDFFATADQSLFAANGGELRGWLAPNGENLTARMTAEEDVHKLTVDLYVTILSRQATQAERDDVAAYLAERAEQKREAVQELAWGLLTSVEFRFQH